MEASARPSPSSFLLFLTSLLVLHHITGVSSVGVNYGTIANNLPPPAQVAQFLKEKTIIDKVKIFDGNPDIIRAFANTNISLSITVPNDQIPTLAKPKAARRWVLANVKPFYPQTQIRFLLVGSEVLHWGDQNIKANLVPAMRSLAHALTREGLSQIKVTTAHSLIILESSNPPSMAKFRPGWDSDILAPMLQYHRQSKSPFMVNPYPYFSFSPQNMAFTLFWQNPGVRDPGSGKTYSNMYDLLLDAVYSSMKKLGYGDVEIAVGEVGWPSMGDPGMTQCSVENARWHNLNIVKRANEGNGTPMMPGKKFETYIFGLFNENQKPGSAAERNFGLFRPDFSPVYDIGIMKGGQSGGGAQPTPVPVTPAPTTGKQWCVPKPEASDAALQKNLDWVCSTGGDCGPVQPGRPCFQPNTVRGHAAYVMNAYYQAHGRKPGTCDFTGTAMVTTTDPSYGGCKYNAN